MCFFSALYLQHRHAAWRPEPQNRKPTRSDPHGRPQASYMFPLQPVFFSWLVSALLTNIEITFFLMAHTVTPYSKMCIYNILYVGSYHEDVMFGSKISVWWRYLGKWWWMPKNWVPVSSFGVYISCWWFRNPARCSFHSVSCISTGPRSLEKVSFQGLSAQWVATLCSLLIRH